MSERNRVVMGDRRFISTSKILDRLVKLDASVVEIGSNDASFRDAYSCLDWVTVDKFGKPDLMIDINTVELRLPFKTGSVDVVVCTEVLEHLTIGSALVSEIARILKARGSAVISVPNIVSVRSRVRVMLGRLPNMAASGDCGPPMEGSGVFMGGRWVAGHVVDFSEARLASYLARGGLGVTNYHKVPLEFSTRRFVGFGTFAVPRWLYPRTFSDFVLVEASPLQTTRS